MSRINNKDDFIRTASEIHNNKYDYSLVEYVKSSVKVKIICPVHGMFEQTPNKHLSGQGCKQCGRNATKMGKDVFIKKAVAVHGNRYDYSQVVYNNNSTKVKIICPIHGAFLQTPHCHITLKQNCPRCSAKVGGMKRCGDNNTAHKQSTKDKKKATCVERYGSKTWAESEEGRQILHNIISSDEVQQKMKDTCQERYGTDFWTQSAEGKQGLHELMSSDEMKQKVINGYQQKYGVDHYMKTCEGRKKASDTTALRIEGMVHHYGVAYAMQDSELIAKSWTTKRRNGTFNTSKPEKTLYLLLCDTFGRENIIEQYIDYERYPFHCDFYVKSLDLFIELNAHWSHGRHWFNKNDERDIKLLTEWQEKSCKKGSRYYRHAIDIWTHRDLLKRDTAINNCLNYVVFWECDLSDAREYLSNVVYDETTK